MGAALQVSANISVGSGGQASYGVPISVPPGIAGMAPNLSLAFSDGGLNGPVGAGWSVQGVSSISRCPPTRAIDGRAGTVAFKPEDMLCLDGQRLLEVPSNPAVAVPAAINPQVNSAAGHLSNDSALVREYRTEKDIYARIRAYGRAGGASGNGPAFFKVWTKSGQIFTYGGNANSRILVQDVRTTVTRGEVAVWAVYRIEDVVGNYIEFEYVAEQLAWGSGTVAAGALGREWNIKEIRYTGTTTGQPANRVTFEYEDKAPDTLDRGSDRGEAYQWQTKSVSVKRLKSVTTWVGTGAAGRAVKTIQLGYSTSPATGRSLVTSIKDCAGGNTSTRCTPPTTFTYSGSAGGPNFTEQAAFRNQSGGLAAVRLHDVQNNYGMLTGDFNGDGKTDILRWAENFLENQLWYSNGDGTFTRQQGSNITSIRPFIKNGCHHSTVADFNGDGLSDLLVAARLDCGVPSVLFLSDGSGNFQARTLLSNVRLQNTKAVTGSRSISCQAPQMAPLASSSTSAPGLQPVKPELDPFGPAAGDREASKLLQQSQLTRFCRLHTRTVGYSYHILDVNGDGLLDIITARSPPYSWRDDWESQPSEAELCANEAPTHGRCTRIFLGLASGGFQEETNTDVADSNLYVDPQPISHLPNPYWHRPAVADFDGDGLQDIISTFSGRWRSRGDGNFYQFPITDLANFCGTPIDFNGDGRTDCLYPEAAGTNQKLTLAYGDSLTDKVVQFNLTSGADNLFAKDQNGAQTVGVIVEDFDGDGRQDILRWGVNATDNGIYLSRGDGYFRQRVPAGLNNVVGALQAVDGATAFRLGDFLGNGTVQLLHIRNAVSANGAPGSSNQLYAGVNNVGPLDALVSVTTPTGLVSRVESRVPLTAGLAANGSGYKSHRVLPQDLASSSSVLDLQTPIFVITATSRETSRGVALTTRYRYEGLKADRGGRGMLGFRQMQQQDSSPATGATPSEITVVTDYLLVHPYIGVATQTRTFLGRLGPEAGTELGALLSRTVNIYCDKTSAAAPTSATMAAPCALPAAASARVVRPYVYKTIEEGWDLPSSGSVPLPKVTTTSIYNDFGDPLTVDVLTEATINGGLQAWRKTTSNTFCEPNTVLPNSGGPCPNRFDDNTWVLGRITRANVVSTAPRLIDSLTVAVGSSPTATAVVGVPPGNPSPPINPAALSVILQLLLED